MMLDVSKIKNKQYRNAIFDKIFKPLAKEKIVSQLFFNNVRKPLPAQA